MIKEIILEISSSNVNREDGMNMIYKNISPTTATITIIIATKARMTATTQ